MIKSYIALLWISLLALETTGQNDEDALFIKQVYNSTLTTAQCYNWLEFLTTKIGGRLSGSPQAAAAVEYTYQMLDTLGLDSVYLQECSVPHWFRGDQEIVRIVNSSIIGTQDLHALALGNSIGTGPDGIVAEVIEVRSLEDLQKLGRKEVEGKIVFFNRSLDDTQLQTFAAYGGAVDQRGIGPSRAARLGAVGVLVRSMTTSIDYIPHTGATNYLPDAPEIPALAISTKDANLLSQLLRKETPMIYIRNTSRMLKEKRSYNVIAEIKGSTHPDEIILVGGHLDSWDVGQGAHDDGAGCVHAMEVLHQIKVLNYTPKRTIRCVLFMNEENGLAGGRVYARQSNDKGEFHMAAIESDAGGFTPRGFSCDANAALFTEYFKKLNSFSEILSPFNLSITKGGGGADIGPLKSQNGILIGFRPDSQRYFDYHHTAIDTFDKVNKRELELGAAAITSLVILLDKYGIK